ncbi:MAG: hypothetical protein JNL96_05195 [Planctomycetaceae bacterium]|nr:hypothetical protein [Planctomycetaceae bacterium]
MNAALAITVLLAAAPTTEYSTKGDPKAAGTDVTLQIPVDWTRERLAMPWGLDVFTAPDRTNSGRRIFISVMPLYADAVATPEKRAAFLADAERRRYYLADAQGLAFSDRLVAGLPARSIEYRRDTMKGRPTINFLLATRTAFLAGGNLVLIDCQAVGPADKRDLITAEYAATAPIFEAMLDSIQIDKPRAAGPTATMAKKPSHVDYMPSPVWGILFNVALTLWAVVVIWVFVVRGRRNQLRAKKRT